MNHYFKCLHNHTLSQDEPADTYSPDLIIGRVYKALPPQPHDGPHRLRIVDGSGEDYLYPASYFEPFTPPSDEPITSTTTLHLPPSLKAILHAEALAHNTSVSALMRAWLDERLDLPVAA